MKNISLWKIGIAFAVFLLVTSVYYPVRAELTGSSNDTPEKRQYLATCQGAVEADVNAQLKAKTIDITQALSIKNERRNKCADEARKMDVPTQKPETSAAPISQMAGSFDLFAQTVKRAPASECAGTSADLQIARNETLEAPEVFTAQGHLIPKGVQGKVYGQDTVTVPDGHYAVLSYGNGQTVFLRSGAQFVLQCPVNETPRGAILRGFVSFFWPKSDTPDFKFQASSHSIIAAIKGTQFAIDSSDSGDTLYVFEGTVAATSPAHPEQSAVDVTGGNAVEGGQAGLGPVRVATVGEFQGRYPGIMKSSAGAEESISALRVAREASPDTSASSAAPYYLVLAIAVVTGAYYGLRRARN